MPRNGRQLLPALPLRTHRSGCALSRRSVIPRFFFRC